MSTQKSLTLVELIVAVSILAIGLVVVLRAFLTNVAGLDRALNKISAMQVLENKMVELEQKAREEGRFSAGQQSQDDVRVGVRPATLTVDISPVVFEEKEDDFEEEEQPPEEEVLINVDKVELTLQWEEERRAREQKMVTCFAFNVTNTTE